MASSLSVAAPMNETQKLFLYEVDDKIAAAYQYNPILSGKWVLFYETQSIAKVWKEVCRLYHEEQLEGIEFVKRSTSKFNERLKDSQFGVVSFICGPCNDRHLVQTYGRKLLKSLQAITPFEVDTMVYSACDPANHVDLEVNKCEILYQLDVPEELTSKDCLCLSEPVLTTKNDPIGSPTTETEEVYLHEFDSDIMDKNQYDSSESGKWMLFYEMKSLDDRWANACSLYRDGELTGVASMKVSTAKYTPRQSTDKYGVIIFYCGPCSDENLMVTYGKCILEKMHMFGPFDNDHMPYKTDIQTLQGTRATGNKNNSIYSLPICEEWRSSNCLSLFWNCYTSNEDLPSQVMDKPFLFERRESISSMWPCHPDFIGHWIMVYDKAWLDRAWKKARDFYRAGKLTGIQSLSVSTAKMMDDRRKTGFINFFCGPKNDLDLVRTFGENLTELMSYQSEKGTMNYRHKKETICSITLANYRQPRKLDHKQCNSNYSHQSNDVRSWRWK